MTPPSTDYNPFNNPNFRKELGDMFDEKMKPVCEILKDHGKRIKDTEDDVEDQGKVLSKYKGAFWILQLLWGGLVTFLGFKK